MKIRLLSPREYHIEQLKTLSASFAAEHSWAGNTPLGQLEDLSQTRAKLFGDQVTAVLVAEHPEGQMVGFCGVYQEQPGVFEAYMLVDQQYRQTGVAKQLTDAVFARLPKNINVEAWVFAQNQEALDAFPRLGFRLREIIDNIALDGHCHQVYLFERST